MRLRLPAPTKKKIGSGSATLLVTFFCRSPNICCGGRVLVRSNQFFYDEFKLQKIIFFCTGFDIISLSNFSQAFAYTQSLEEKFEGIRSDMFVQTTNVGKLAHIQLKDRERDQLLGQERDQLVRSTMDKLKGQHADLMQAMTIFGKDIDDKMKDIRSLLLGKEVHNLERI